MSWRSLTLAVGALVILAIAGGIALSPLNGPSNAQVAPPVAAITPVADVDRVVPESEAADEADLCARW
jgi:hypothetical protein